MLKILTIGIPLFLLITFLVRKFFEGTYKKETSKRWRKTWGARMYYWHFIVMFSGFATTLIIVFLKWGHLL